MLFHQNDETIYILAKQCAPTEVIRLQPLLLLVATDDGSHHLAHQV